ncbi:hypothetical protein ACO2Q3_11605 [Caulobacter sp. KR2-114]
MGTTVLLGTGHALAQAAQISTSPTPSGGANAEGLAINGDGTVAVGDSSAPGGGLAPVIYTPGGAITFLGTIGDPNTLDLGKALGVSADGRIVVGYVNNSHNGGQLTAFRWTQAGGVVALPFLVSSSSLGPGIGNAAIAYGTSRDGSVIVGAAQASTGACCQRDAVKWTGSGVVDLGYLPGNYAAAGAPFGSEAHAVSDDGAIVVGQSFDVGVAVRIRF